MKVGEMKELKIIVKADVQGSVEAVRQSLEKLTNDEVRVHVIHGAVGAINESDVMLANASNAMLSASTSARIRSRRKMQSATASICACTASSTTASRRSNPR